MVICQIPPDLCSDACYMGRIPGGWKKKSLEKSLSFKLTDCLRNKMGSWAEGDRERHTICFREETEEALKDSCSPPAGTRHYGGTNYSPSLSPAQLSYWLDVKPFLIFTHCCRSYCFTPGKKYLNLPVSLLNFTFLPILYLLLQGIIVNVFGQVDFPLRLVFLFVLLCLFWGQSAGWSFICKG